MIGAGPGVGSVRPVTCDPIPAMPADMHAAAVAARGFMPTDEGDALWAAAGEGADAVPGAPVLENGA